MAPKTALIGWREECITLVVCPLATLKQWHQETTLAESQCEGGTKDPCLDRDLTYQLPRPEIPGTPDSTIYVLSVRLEDARGSEWAQRVQVFPTLGRVGAAQH